MELIVVRLVISAFVGLLRFAYSNPAEFERWYKGFEEVARNELSPLGLHRKRAARVSFGSLASFPKG